MASCRDEYLSDGTYIKRISDWVELGGSAGWYQCVSHTSIQEAKIPGSVFSNSVVGGQYVKALKYNLTKLVSYPFPDTAPDAIYMNPSDVFALSVSNIDGGFSEGSVSVNEIKAYFYGWKMCNADGTSPYQLSLVPYTASTWAEWTKYNTINTDSSGAELVAVNGDTTNLSMNSAFKVSTKYGIIYNVVSTDLDSSFYIYNYLTGGSVTLDQTIGNNKTTITTQGTITTNSLKLSVSQANTSGKKIKIKDIRIFELPTGSVIEADFTNLTADQLAAKYTFNGLCPKNWKKITDGTSQTAVLPTATYAGYTPYKMCYQLAQPVYSGPKWATFNILSNSVYYIDDTAANISKGLIVIPADHIYYGSLNFGDKIGLNYLEGFTCISGAIPDSTGSIGKYRNNGGSYITVEIAFAKGTTIAQMQSATVGKKLYYQLATPTSAIPVLDAVASGTAYLEYADGTALPVTPQLTYKVDSGFNSYEQVKVNGDSKLLSHKTIKAGERAQIRFSFNLIRAFEDAYGAIPSTGTDVASKVAWLKNNIDSIGFGSWVYGSGPSGNKVYNNYLDNGAWSATVSNNTASSPSQIYRGPAPISGIIDASGCFNGINYADPSDGTTASQVFMDYTNISVTFKNSNNTLELFTNASVETEFFTSGKSPAYLVEVDLTNLANQVGGNVTLKSLAKSIVLDAWAQGYGAYQGQVKDEVDIAIYDAAWGSTVGSSFNKNTTGAIAKASFTKSTTPNASIQTSNKVYFVIYSKYPSDATIQSSLSLDYLGAKLNLTRIPDTVSPITFDI
jgi:hypothetical protein